MTARPPIRQFRFSLQTLFVLVAVAAVLSGVGLLVRETMPLFTERDLASFFPTFKRPHSVLVDVVVLVGGVVIVFAGWTYYRATR